MSTPEERIEALADYRKHDMMIAKHMSGEDGTIMRRVELYSKAGIRIC